MPITSILFDLDGVLVDSRHATASFFAAILQAQGYAAPTQAECEAVYHLPAVDAVARLTGETDGIRIEALSAAIACEEYPLDLVEPAGCGPNVLTELAYNYRLGVVSSRIRAGLIQVLARFFDARLFDAVVGYEDTASHKPDPEPLIEGVRRLGATPGEALYVGDSPTDIVAARRANMLAVAYGSSEPPPGGDVRITSLMELPAICDMLNRRSSL